MRWALRAARRIARVAFFANSLGFWLFFFTVLLRSSAGICQNYHIRTKHRPTVDRYSQSYARLGQIVAEHRVDSRRDRPVSAVNQRFGNNRRAESEAFAEERRENSLN